jgi:hypothetical protein
MADGYDYLFKVRDPFFLFVCLCAVLFVGYVGLGVAMLCNAVGLSFATSRAPTNLSCLPF